PRWPQISGRPERAKCAGSISVLGYPIDEPGLRRAAAHLHGHPPDLRREQAAAAGGRAGEGHQELQALLLGQRRDRRNPEERSHPASRAEGSSRQEITASNPPRSREAREVLFGFLVRAHLRAGPAPTQTNLRVLRGFAVD